MINKATNEGFDELNDQEFEDQVFDDDEGVPLNSLYQDILTRTPKLKAGSLGPEEFHWQSKILRAIRKASKKTQAELEDLFGRGNPSAGNEGKAWRRWESGEHECRILDKIIKRAKEENWLDEETLAIIDYVEKKKVALSVVDQRQNEFNDTLNEAIALLRKFKQLCDDAYDREEKSPEFAYGLGIIQHSFGEDEESWNSVPWTRQDNDKHFAALEKNLNLLEELSLNEQPIAVPDPVTGKIDYLGMKYPHSPKQIKEINKKLKSLGVHPDFYVS